MQLRALPSAYCNFVELVHFPLHLLLLLAVCLPSLLRETIIEIVRDIGTCQTRRRRKEEEEGRGGGGGGRERRGDNYDY